MSVTMTSRGGVDVLTSMWPGGFEMRYRFSGSPAYTATRTVALAVVLVVFCHVGAGGLGDGFSAKDMFISSTPV